MTYAGQLAGSGIGFVIQLLLQRQLGPSDYGLLGLATSIGTLTGVMTDLGLSHAMVRFGSRCLSEGNRRGAAAHFAATLWLRLGLAVIVSLVGFSTAHLVATSLFNKPELGGPLAYTYAGVFAGALYSW